MSSKIFILGPCSAESAEQVRKTAQEIHEIGNSAYHYANLTEPTFCFRAGIWKPRTRPDSFSGIGDIGLEWLSGVEQEYGIEVMTEVASREHVLRCLSEGIMSLWIGARTTGDPFAVQQIADSLSELSDDDKSRVRVLIKNPISPDIDLWCGAVERIEKAGIRNIILIHRGFSWGFQKGDAESPQHEGTPHPKLVSGSLLNKGDAESPQHEEYTQQKEWYARRYRNQPLWSIPIEMHMRYPRYKMLCDASHISGDALLVPEIAQQAMNLNFDGLMLEVHPTPAVALSDAKQQLSFPQIEQLLHDLQIPQCTEEDQSLVQMREQINELDNAIWDLIAQRLDIASRIGEHKKEHNMAVLQESRYKEILSSRLHWAASHGISATLVKSVVEALHTEAVNRQL